MRRTRAEDVSIHAMSPDLELLVRRKYWRRLATNLIVKVTIFSERITARLTGVVVGHRIYGRHL
jgi:hypothetical protein